MSVLRVSLRRSVCICAVLLLAASGERLKAQAARLGADDGQRVTLRDSVVPMAQAQFDQGPADDAMAADRMLLLLGRPPQQAAALDAFVAQLQDKGSAAYHQYLTPQQFAAQYGPPDADVQAVTAWLERQGFTVNKVSAARQVIEFSGSAGQVRQAFQTAIHRYLVGGKLEYANASAPQIPAALAPVVRGVMMSSFGPKPMSVLGGQAKLDRATHRVVPQFNVPLDQSDCLNGYCFAVTPGDFAAIYDTKPLLASGIDGTGITIGVVGDAPLDLPSVQAYRENFLPAYSATNLPTPVLEGPAPTVYGSDNVEADLDVEEAGGVAPNASIDYYYGATGFTSDGVDLALIRAIDDDQVSILSISFGGCESYFGNTYDAFYDSLYEQAAAEGMTVVAASGDSGSAACDPPPGTSGYWTAVGGLAVSGMASTPYNVAVGGTDFYYPANATTSTLSSYWGDAEETAPGNNPDWSSAKKYIPEKPWDTSDVILNQVPSYLQSAGGGGGKSSCVVSSGATPNVCQSGYPQPSWQAGTTQDSVRDVPDVSLFAAVAGNYSFTAACMPQECETTGGPNSTTEPLIVAEIGGTSVSAPSMAGIFALVEQKAGTRLGQADAVLYPLAAQKPTAFHDITVGTNTVQCQSGSPDCGSDGYLTGYSAAAGYDLATGLGSVDAAVLADAWSDVTGTSTTTTLTVTPASATHGQALTFTVTVTGAASGNVALLTTAAGNGLEGQYATSCAAFPCTFTYAGLPGGSYNVAARFAGDATHAASTSAQVPVTIAPQPSQLAIYDQVANSELQPINGVTVAYGTIVEFLTVPLAANATLPANPFLLAAPATGTITVTDNGVALGTPLVLNAQGNATVNESMLPPGQHSLVVSYSGDASYGPSSSIAPVATPMSFTVVKAPSSVEYFGAVGAVVPGTAVPVTVMVQAENLITMTGSVVLSVTTPQGTTTTLAPAPISFWPTYGFVAASLTIPAADLAPGVNTLSAVYEGDSNFLASAPAATTVLVEAANTSLTLNMTPTSLASGQSAQVEATLDFPALPNVLGISGDIEISLDGNSLCGVSFGDVWGGSVGDDCQLKNAQPGNHTLTAVYNGDQSYTAATTSLSFTVSGTSPVSFGLTATPVTLPGQTTNPSGTSTLTVSLSNPLSNAVTLNLSCSTAEAPAGMTCTVPATVSVAAGSTSATATATVALAGTTAAVDGRPLRAWGTGGVALLALLAPLTWVRRRRRWPALAVLAVLLVGMCGLSSCGSAKIGSGGGGGSGHGGTVAAGAYTLTVTAAAGTVGENASILVRVQ